jgi:hypothetical protein
MGGRRPFADGPGPHEKRFEYIEFPDIYTKVEMASFTVGEETPEHLLPEGEEGFEHVPSVAIRPAVRYQLPSHLPQI